MIILNANNQLDVAVAVGVGIDTTTDGLSGLKITNMVTSFDSVYKYVYDTPA